MERQKTVLDASVVMKWFVDEPLSDKARKLTQDHRNKTKELFAPDILVYEIGNALHFRHFDIEEIKRAFFDIANLQMNVERPNSTLLLNAVRLAEMHNLTVYDAAYAALAEMIGAELVTADAKLAKLPFAMHLKDV